MAYICQRYINSHPYQKVSNGNKNMKPSPSGARLWNLDNLGRRIKIK